MCTAEGTGGEWEDMIKMFLRLNRTLTDMRSNYSRRPFVFTFDRTGNKVAYIHEIFISPKERIQMQEQFNHIVKTSYVQKTR